MTDLQLGLLVIGAAAVVGVLAYNRLQERATRREGERSFGSQHSDVLLEAPAERREPTLHPTPEPPPPPPPPRASRAAPSSSDGRVDYVMTLEGVSAGALHADWAVLERRFARRATLAEEGGAARATLQMLNRDGVVSEAELVEFRSKVEALAAAHRAAVSAPPMREALQAAQALDRACAELDVQIALHVIGPGQAKLEEQRFSVAPRTDGVTLLLDVPRTAELAKSYAAMVQATRRLGGRVVDDNGNTLDERVLALIGVEVESLRRRLTELGIEPGSPLALRVFS